MSQISSDIALEVRRFLEKSLAMKDFSDDTNIFKAGFVNSMFALQLVSFTEKHFDIEVEDDDLELSNFMSVNAVAAFVRRKRGN